MNGILLDVDIPICATKTSHEFVVISRDVDDAGALPGLAQNFLDDVVMLLRPINSATQRPDIDEISHYIESVEVILTEKIE